MSRSTFWQYDAAGQMLQVCNSTPTNVISKYEYAYDAAGRRISCSHSGSAFDHADHIDYGYNNRSELTNASATIDTAYSYSYRFDDIGNRESAFERGTNIVYAANRLNQYVAVDDFSPQFDDDGNGMRVETSTGIWSVTYNGENRPILWAQGTNTISMSYDRFGRRVAKSNQRFVYDGYLQIANFDSAATNSQLTIHNSQLFIWDATEPVATRPLVWTISTTQPFNISTSFYAHDGNKNASEIIAEDEDVAAHYEYAPFGAVTIQNGMSAAANPWRFSSEYAENGTLMWYYTQHYGIQGIV